MLDWIRFVDKHDHKVMLKTDRIFHCDFLLDFFSCSIVHPVQSVTKHLSSHSIRHPSINNLMSKSQLDWTQIHLCLGHPSDSVLACMCRSQKMKELPKIFPRKLQRHHEIFPICAKGKLRTTNHGHSTDTSKLQPGQLLHIDFTFYNKPSIRGFTSVLLIVDTRTRNVCTFCSSSKRPPIDVMRFFFHNFAWTIKLHNISDVMKVVRLPSLKISVNCFWNLLSILPFNQLVDMPLGSTVRLNVIIKPSTT